MQFQTLKMAAISEGQGRLRSNSRTRCLLPLVKPLPSFVEISKIDLIGEKFEVKFADKVPLTPCNVPTKFRWNNQNRMGEKCKSVIYFIQNIDYSPNLDQLGPNFALHSGTTHDMCKQNIMGISAKLRALGPRQRFDYTFWICGGFKPITYTSHTSRGTL